MKYIYSILIVLLTALAITTIQPAIVHAQEQEYGKVLIYKKPLFGGGYTSVLDPSAPRFYLTSKTVLKSVEIDLAEKSKYTINPGLVVELYGGFVHNKSNGEYIVGTIAKKNFADDYIRLYLATTSSQSEIEVSSYYRINGSFIFWYAMYKKSLYLVVGTNQGLLITEYGESISVKYLGRSFMGGYPIYDDILGKTYYILYDNRGTHILDPEDNILYTINNYVPIYAYNGSLYTVNALGGHIVVNKIRDGVIVSSYELKDIQVANQASISDIVAYDGIIIVLYKDMNNEDRLALIDEREFSYATYSIKIYSQSQLPFSPSKLYVEPGYLKILFEAIANNNHFIVESLININALQKGYQLFYGHKENYGFVLESIATGSFNATYPSNSIASEQVELVDVEPSTGPLTITLESSSIQSPLELDLAIPVLKLVEGLPETIKSSDYSKIQYIITVKLTLLNKPLANRNVTLTIIYDNETKYMVAQTDNSGRASFLIDNSTVPITGNTTLKWIVEALGLNITGETAIVFPPPPPSTNTTTPPSTTSPTATTGGTPNTQPSGTGGAGAETTAPPEEGGGINTMLIVTIVVIVIVIAGIIIFLKRR